MQNEMDEKYQLWQRTKENKDQLQSIIYKVYLDCDKQLL